MSMQIEQIESFTIKMLRHFHVGGPLDPIIMSMPSLTVPMPTSSAFGQEQRRFAHPGERQLLRKKKQPVMRFHIIPSANAPSCVPGKPLKLALFPRLISLGVVALSLSIHGPALRAAESSQMASVAMTPLVLAGEPRCAIVAVPEDALSRRTAAKLAEYLREQTGAKPPVLSEANLASDTHATLIILDGTTNHLLLARFGISINGPGDRDDAYHLRVVHQDKRTVVAVAGHAPSGAKYGAYRLMEDM